MVRSHPSKRLDERLHRLFEVSIGVKALFAFSELISGLGVYLIPSGWVVTAARWLTAQELAEDPHDRLAQALMGLAQGISLDSRQFWAAYLIGHAVVKLAVVAGLVLRIRWAYPASIVVLIGFIAYQMDRWVQTRSTTMLALSAFDLLVIWLVWREYRGLRAGPDVAH
jgi:uncharacterized membrane protein